ncbi:fatty-acid-binding protein 3, chloroplastic isoform X1 [Phoenix dactylifera]|uniref:Chalcone-flavonone isomerase family protein n=1 Tax=Phoenix dactylifera TaxID=42345 RepID=A0A8B7BSC7_PHODC|nr:fatty-acid-binding protein 3, chloroplastic isoform X1 [Phoenix dactylifera]XP_008784379.2 fatty-acid-binding protein 3, chloroplastic isoform X1 [Phoenix dactylifera]
MLGAVSHPARPPSLVSRCRTKAAPFFVLERRPLLRAFSTFPCLNSLHSPFIPRASVGSSEYVMEPGTNVKFPRELRVPGCSGLLVLLGTGYREKVFAIIGIKVYAAGFYAEPSIRERLDAWKGKPAAEILDDCSLFSSILQAPLEKSLNIMLVRDVDGKTFWNALDDVISPRIKNPTSVDESALLTFRNTFQSRDLKQGTFIFLTWVEPSKMLISISSGGFPSKVDAEIESANVSMALYDAFLGESPVSPTLKTSVANGLTEIFS